MYYIATYDVGTTAVKGVLVSSDGEIKTSELVQIKTYFQQDYKEQKPDDWFDAFCQIGKKFTSHVGADKIKAVIMSGQMQDLILVDEAGRPLRDAILYSDARAGLEAAKIQEMVTEDKLEAITCNHFDGSMPLAKLLWVKEHEPEIYAKTRQVLISSKDYIIRCLTGIACGDATACATAGAMNLKQMTWDEELITAATLNLELFPPIKYPHEVVGTVVEEMQDLCGYDQNTVVYAGIGDAGATTLASGIASFGEFNVNIGTSGWVATISNSPLDLHGRVFNLAGFSEKTYINVVPFFNAGNVHKWITKVFSEGDSLDYEKSTKLLESSVPGCHGVLFLPYITGERFPVIDPDIRGAYYGITPDTSAEDLTRACLEGVAFSVRQGLELIDCEVKSVSLIGGGARVAVWCQILADVLGKDVKVYKKADILPAKALASAVLLANGEIADYGDFVKTLQDEDACITYRASNDTHEIYNEVYRKFVKLYPHLRGL